MAPVAGQASTPQEKKPAAAPEQSVEELFADFIHYAKIGRFTAADSAAKTLLSHPALKPEELLDVSARDRDSMDTLLTLIAHSTIGESAKRVLEVIEKGEYLRRKDPRRIRVNIQNLGGHPQAMAIAISRLKDSGEYAVPHLMDALLDAKQQDIWPRIITALPQLGKAAVNPLVMALHVDNEDVRQNVIQALGAIGYPQAVPYLRKVAGLSNVPPETKDAAAAAIKRIETTIGRDVPGESAELFYRLAEQYFNEDDSVRADPRLDQANTWYWDAKTRGLNPIVVPTKIYGQVMAMRCCEEALTLRRDHQGAIGLWLASNVRRESKLGMNVESGDPNEQGEADATRPDVFPRALYATQAAGPRYAHLVLDRALRAQDTALALGAVEALRATAGESSLIGNEDYKQPLAQCLRFPDKLVRIRAALALAAALPKTHFADSEFVVPLLAGTIALSGNEQLLVVDPNQENLNRVVSGVRQGGNEVVGETSFFRGVERARTELPSLAGIFLATDLTDPGPAEALSWLRKEFLFAKTPVVVLTKRTHGALADDLAKNDPFVQAVNAQAEAAELTEAFQSVRTRAGHARIDDQLAKSLALEAVRTLGRIANSGRTVYDVTAAAPALIGALASPDEKLLTSAAEVLAMAPTPQAQRAIAYVALNEKTTKPIRMATFASLAESARTHGPMLEDAQVTTLLAIVRNEKDLELRTAASQALGALNVKTEEASEIIRSLRGE
ncbi:MAG: HEAT repeat domain-containing protein [Planctomycetota bacterium]